MIGRASRRAYRFSVLCEPEFLRDDKSVIADRESRITKSLTHLGRVPELLMAPPPLRDRGKSFAFAQRVVQVHIGQPYHPHRGRLDNRDAAACSAHRHMAQPGSRQRVVLGARSSATIRGCRWRA